MQGADLPPLAADASEVELARWLLERGARVLVTGKTYAERHLVEDLAGLPEKVTSLSGLDLTSADPRTDALLQRLSAVEVARGLTHLDLARTQVSGAGLASLSALPWLKRLDLSDTPVGLDEVRLLAEHPELEDVQLDGTDLGGLTLDEVLDRSDLPSSVRHLFDTGQRGLARVSDLALAALALRLLPRPSWAQEGLSAFVVQGLAAAALALIVEILGVACCGTTPGKALLRVRVQRSEGLGRPGLLQAGRRAAGAWVAGLACGARPLSWLASAWTARGLLAGRPAAWDRWSGTRALPRQCSTLRAALAVALIALSLYRF